MICDYDLTIYEFSQDIKIRGNVISFTCLIVIICTPHFFLGRMLHIIAFLMKFLIIVVLNVMLLLLLKISCLRIILF